MISIIAVIVISYLLGTLPSALVLTKLFYGFDIRQKGSGNIGAMNSFQVTGNRYIGIAVFLLDALKGIAAVLIAWHVFKGEMLHISLAVIWVVIGHNWNIFLRFTGGRGLASAAGALAIINPLTVILWAVMWVSGYFAVRRDIIVANAIALFAAPVLLISSPNEFVRIFNVYPIEKMLDLKIMLAVLSVIILIKHIQPLKQIFRTKDF